MKLDVVNESGKSTASVDVSENVFGARFNEPLIYQLVVAHQAGGRQGTRAQKNRAAVRGGGAKPFAQKGTGKARAGTIRSPLWRGGGKIFPSRTADFSQKVNKKMRRAGMRSILSELVRQERFTAVDNFSMSAPKTKELVGKLNKLKTDNVLIVTAVDDNNLTLSARNLARVNVCSIDHLDPVSLVGHEKVIMTRDAVKKCEELFA